MKDLITLYRLTLKEYKVAKPMRLRAWYVNKKCVLVIDQTGEHSDFSVDPIELTVFDSVMIFSDTVELGESVEE